MPRKHRPGAPQHAKHTKNVRAQAARTARSRDRTSTAPRLLTTPPARHWRRCAVILSFLRMGDFPFGDIGVFFDERGLLMAHNTRERAPTVGPRAATQMSTEHGSQSPTHGIYAQRRVVLLHNNACVVK